MSTATDINRSWTESASDPLGVTRIVASHSLVIDRTNQPNFRQKIMLGQFLPPLAYTMSKLDEIHKIYGMRAWRWNQQPNTKNLCSRPNTDLGMVYGTLKSVAFLNLTTTTPGLETESVCISKAIQRFYSNAKELKSSIGVSIAEAPRTFNLIASTATRLANSFLFLRKGQIGKAFAELQYTNNALERRLRSQYKFLLSHELKRVKRTTARNWASSAWLEMQYGWTPLLSEVFNACEDLASRFAAVPSDLTIRGGYACKAGRNWTVNFNGNQTVPKAYVFTFNPDENFFERKVGFVCSVRVIDSVLRAKANLGMSNPAAIAWELLPWSFVVDWFVPIGAFIESLNATSGYAFVGGSRSVLTRDYRQYSTDGISPTSLSTNQFREIVSGQASYSYKSVNFVRTVLTNFPNPAFILRVKSLDEAFSLRRTTSALALLAQAFGR